ncbi:hypothetical protein BH11ARM1_BH11ARM1_10680 [soil metagenome]
MGASRKILGAIIGAVVGVTLWTSGALQPLEWQVTDAAMALRGIKDRPCAVAVVLFDEATLKAWPEPTPNWGSHIAGLVDRLADAGARAIVFDFALAPGDHPDENTMRSNGALGEAILRHQDLLILGFRYDGDGKAVKPAPELLLSDKIQLATMDIHPDSDGVLRRFPASSATSLCEAAAARMIRSTPRYPGRLSDTARWQIPILSAVGALSADAVRGRVVIVGFGPGSYQDTVRLAALGQVPGPEAQARLSAATLSGPLTDVRGAGAWGLALLCAGIGLLAIALSRNLSWPFVILAIVSLMFLILIRWGLVLPTLAPLLLGSLISLGAKVGQGIDEGALRARIEGAFAYQLDRKAFDFFMANPEYTAPGASISVEGCVMFLDVRKSTALAAALGEVAFFAKLNDLFAKIVPIVSSHGGVLVNFTGDGFLAVFGPFATGLNGAESAIAAAREMVNARGASDPEIGIGIHGGGFLLGNLGGAHRVQFTAIGDVVNLAARVESATKEVGVDALVSEAVFLAAGTEPCSEPLTIQPANHPLPLIVYPL